MLNRAKEICFGRPGSPAPDRLILGDNLEVARTIEDESLDAIYVDPPFGTGQARRGRGASYRDPGGPPDVFVEWIRPRLVEFHRLLAPTGSLFVHLDQRTIHYVKVEMDRIFGRGRFVNEIVWCYSVGGKSSRRFARKHDTILWYGKSSDYAFYPDAVRVARKPSSHMRVRYDEEGRPYQEKTDKKTGKVYRYPVHEGKVPEDWWADIETLNRGDKERTGWPTQKPLRLLERILSATTRPGDSVADFFSGSATTAAAAQLGDRRFLAVDAEAAAIRCALERLETAGHKLAEGGSPPRNLVVETTGALRIQG